jgi:hypothetical protein
MLAEDFRIGVLVFQKTSSTWQVFKRNWTGTQENGTEVIKKRPLILPISLLTRQVA